MEFLHTFLSVPACRWACLLNKVLIHLLSFSSWMLTHVCVSNMKCMTDILVCCNRGRYSQFCFFCRLIMLNSQSSDRWLTHKMCTDRLHCHDRWLTPDWQTILSWQITDSWDIYTDRLSCYDRWLTHEIYADRLFCHDRWLIHEIYVLTDYLVMTDGWLMRYILTDYPVMTDDLLMRYILTDCPVMMDGRLIRGVWESILWCDSPTAWLVTTCSVKVSK